jgi:hypothetical protein
MKTLEYCTHVENELAGWRDKLGSIDHRIEGLSCGAKEKMLGNIEELHMLMAEVDDRIMALKTSCPTEWRPVGEEIDERPTGGC